MDEDPAGGAAAREALSAALKALLTLPVCAREAAPPPPPLPCAGGMDVAGWARLGGGAEGGKVVTVVRFVMEGTLEEALEDVGAGIGGLEVRF